MYLGTPIMSHIYYFSEVLFEALVFLSGLTLGFHLFSQNFCSFLFLSSGQDLHFVNRCLFTCTTSFFFFCCFTLLGFGKWRHEGTSEIWPGRQNILIPFYYCFYFLLHEYHQFLFWKLSITFMKFWVIEWSLFRSDCLSHEVLYSWAATAISPPVRFLTSTPKKQLLRLRTTFSHCIPFLCYLFWLSLLNF